MRIGPVVAKLCCSLLISACLLASVFIKSVNIVKMSIAGRLDCSSTTES